MFRKLSVAVGAALFLLLAGLMMSPSAHAQTAPTPTPNPACVGNYAYGSATAGTTITNTQYTFNGVSQNITEVCVRLANGTTTSGQVKTNTPAGGSILNCWTVTGIGTNSATLKRISTASSCDTMQLFAVEVTPPVTPAPAAPVATPAPTTPPAATPPAAGTTPAAPAATPVRPAAAAPVAPAPAKTGNAGLLQESTSSGVVMLLVILSIGTIAGGRALAGRKR